MQEIQDESSDSSSSRSDASSWDEFRLDFAAFLDSVEWKKAENIWYKSFSSSYQKGFGRAGIPVIIIFWGLNEQFPFTTCKKRIQFGAAGPERRFHSFACDPKSWSFPKSFFSTDKKGIGM